MSLHTKMAVVPLSMNWTEIKDSAGLRFQRRDGAVVKFSMGPRRLDWIAYEPDPSEKYLSRTNGRLVWPRRWGSAEAAMKAVDHEYPARAFLEEK